MIYHVVAMARNRVIGKDNKLPWHFSADLQHFKKLTLGQTVLMGRKTFESIGKPLPGRENFVLTSHPQPDQAHLKYFSSIDTALSQVQTEHCYIIGGAKVYEQTLNHIHGIYLTRIDADYEGDAFYPVLPASFEVAKKEKLQDNPFLEIICYHKV